MTLGVLPYITATQEFVVPRSIPITAPVFFDENEAKAGFLKRVLIILI